ncbi:MAG: ABC transporter C-terminal domain-containing protein, partial [Terriglobales bacterium]
STTVLGLDGFRGAERFADYAQWEVWQGERIQTVKAGSAADSGPPPASAGPTPTSAPARKKLSYLEAREYATIEERIAQAEEALKSHQAALEDPAIVSDAPRLIVAQGEIEKAAKALDTLIRRWAELEEKQG